MAYRIDDPAENYRKMADGELTDLFDQRDQLTPQARAALEAELARRNIAVELEQEPSESDEEERARDIEYLSEVMPGSEAENEPPEEEFVAVFSAPTEAGVEKVQAILRSAGIESHLQIVVLVHQDSADKAIELVSHLDSEP